MAPNVARSAWMCFMSFFMINLFKNQKLNKKLVYTMNTYVS